MKKFILFILVILFTLQLVSAERTMSFTNQKEIIPTIDKFEMTKSSDSIIFDEPGFFKPAINVKTLLIVDGIEKNTADYGNLYTTQKDGNWKFGLLTTGFQKTDEYYIAFEFSEDYGKPYFNGRYISYEDEGSPSIDFIDMLVQKKLIQTFANGTNQYSQLFVPEWDDKNYRLLFKVKGNVDADPTVRLSSTSEIEDSCILSLTPTTNYAPNTACDISRNSNKFIWGQAKNSTTLSRNDNARIIFDEVNLSITNDAGQAGGTGAFIAETREGRENEVSFNNISASEGNNISGVPVAWSTSAPLINVFLMTNKSQAIFDNVSLGNARNFTIPFLIKDDTAAGGSSVFTSENAAANSLNMTLRWHYAGNLTNGTLNYTNATFSTDISSLNASVFLNVDSSQNYSVTASLFVNRVLNMTLTNVNASTNIKNQTFSFVFKTNFALNDVVHIQFNATDGTAQQGKHSLNNPLIQAGSTNFLNTTAITVSGSNIQLTNIEYRNKTNSNDTNMLANTVIDNVTARITVNAPYNATLNLTVYYPNNSIVAGFNNALMSNQSATVFYYLTDWTLRDIGRYNISVVARGSDGTSATSTAHVFAYNNVSVINYANFRTTNNTNSAPVAIYQNVTFFEANMTDINFQNLTVNLSVLDASNNVILTNASMSNSSYSNFTYTRGVFLNSTGNWIFRFYAWDGYNLTQSSTTVNVTSPLIRAIITANGTAASGTVQHFIANLTLDTTGLRDLTGLFIYNNTPYTSNITTTNSTSREARETITIPIVATSTGKDFFWNFTFDYGGNQYKQNLTVSSQTITPIGFKTCSGGDLLAFNFTHRDEDNQTTLTGDFEGTFLIYQSDININTTINLTQTNLTSHPICLIDNSTTIKTDAIIKYSVSGYDPRYLYLFNETITNVTNNRSIFSLPIALADSIILEVTDEVGVGIPNILTKVERYYVGENQYKTVAMTKSGPDGRDVTFIRFNDATYRFLLYRNYELALQTEDQKISSTITMLTFRLVPTSIKDIISTFEKLNWNLSISGFNFSLEYNDPSRKSTMNCLIVTKRLQLNDTELARKCSTSFTSKMSYTVSNQTGKYFGVYYSTINPESYQDLVILEILEESVSEAVRFGKTGLLMGGMIITTLSAVGSWNPIVAILMGVLGFFATNAFGLVVIKWAFMIGVFIAALIAIFKLRT